MNAEQKKIVTRLQDNLYTIRQLAGWSAEQLGELLDVSMQTIYNLERGNPRMSWVQYLAIRKILELEIEQQPDNELLKKAVIVLLDNEDLPEEELKELQGALKTIAKGMARSNDRSDALKFALQTVGAATAGIAAGILTKSYGMGITTWLTLAGGLNDSKGVRHGK